MTLKKPRYKPVDLPAAAPPELHPVLPAALSPQEIQDLAVFVFGPDRWKAPLARALGSTYRTVLRWSDGTSPIDGPAIAALYLLAGRHPLQTGSTAPARPVEYKKPTEPKPKPVRQPRERIAPKDKPAPVAARYQLP